ncbi:Cu(I)-responsive transcriptional regulator [soil metagenome]
MNEWSIGDVSREAGVRPSTIRYYESIGVLPLPRRVSGRRRYEREVLRRLAVVRMAREVGCSLEEIRMLFHGFGDDVPASDRWRKLAKSRISEIEAQIACAEAMRQVLRESLRCDCITFDTCEFAESSCWGTHSMQDG